MNQNKLLVQNFQLAHEPIVFMLQMNQVIVLLKHHCLKIKWTVRTFHF